MRLILDRHSVRSAISASLVAALFCFTPTVMPEKLPELVHGEQLNCLAMNIYHEARGESIAGMMAVSAVTMNRVRSLRYPSTICEVVWQPLQFSWTRVNSQYHIPNDASSWKVSQEIAKLFLDGARWPGVGNATHYHSVAVQPYWMDSESLVARYGNHLFYEL